MTTASEKLRVVLRRAVRIFGRTLRCDVCGKPLSVVIPFVQRGELVVLGAQSRIRVDWRSGNRLRFRHMQISDCRAQRTP